MGLQTEAVADLETALRDVVAELRDSHPRWTIDETYRMDGQVECDLSRVQQLLSNLLGNALAYGAPSEPLVVKVSIDLFWLEISVRNGGQPISPDNLQKIFEPFWRPAESRPGGGLGLGLHICSQIVKAHGGVLQVSSSIENGTCVTARLPTRAGSTAVA